MTYYYSDVKPVSDEKHIIKYKRTVSKEIVIKDSFEWLSLRKGFLICSHGDEVENYDDAQITSKGRYLFEKYKFKPVTYLMSADGEEIGTMVVIKIGSAEGYIISTVKPEEPLAFHYCFEELTSFGAGLMKCVLKSNDRMLGYTTKAQCPKEPEIVLWDAVSRLHGRLISLIRINIEGVLKEYDSEFLHDFRVSVRRLRSVMSIIKGAFTKEHEDRYRGRFGYLSELTGRARDMDVYLGQIDAYSAYLPDALKEGLVPVKEHFLTVRGAEYDRLKEYIQSEEFKDMLAEWQRLTQSRGEIGRKGFVSAKKAAAKALLKSYALVDRLTGALDNDTGVQDIHSIRIAFKKLRYCIEFFGLYLDGGRAEDVLTSLRELQDALGRYNDLCIQCGHMSDMLESCSEPKTAAACGYILSVLTDEKKEARDRCILLIAEFRKRKKHILKTLKI